MRALGFLAVLMGALFGAPGCDHGSGSPGNVLPVVVNAGPPGGSYVNGLFTSITVCAPGTASCKTLDSVLVDTGSVGLRVLSSAAGGALSAMLPQKSDAEGDPIVECSAFVDGYTWGSLRLADIQMGNEEARSVPIQLIGDPNFPEVPESCKSGGGANEDSLETLNTYGILGVGPFPQDCGGLCAASIASGDNPGNVYYTCPSSGCRPAAVPVEAQVQNPVSMLPTDNNGVVVELPAVPPGGAPSVEGTLVFGIGTQPNNSLGAATVLPIDPEFLTFTTKYRGVAYKFSFIDSGSNALYFLDPTVAGAPPACAKPDNDFYCPETTVSLTATNVGIDGSNSTVTFSVANAKTLDAGVTNFVFGDLAGISGTGASNHYFDWGLPFFFGRSVFTSIEGSDAPGGETPYFAY